MRIFVNSNEGGKPFELFTHEDNQLDQPGWYYMLLQPVDPESEVSVVHVHEGNMYEALEDSPQGPFESLTAAFNDAINCHYTIGKIKADDHKTC